MHVLHWCSFAELKKLIIFFKLINFFLSYWQKCCKTKHLITFHVFGFALIERCACFLDGTCISVRGNIHVSGVAVKPAALAAGPHHSDMFCTFFWGLLHHCMERTCGSGWWLNCKIISPLPLQLPREWGDWAAGKGCSAACPYSVPVAPAGARNGCYAQLQPRWTQGTRLLVWCWDPEKAGDSNPAGDLRQDYPRVKTLLHMSWGCRALYLLQLIACRKIHLAVVEGEHCFEVRCNSIS